nr:hypothetical protein [Clostridia bacterium]
VNPLLDIASRILKAKEAGIYRLTADKIVTYSDKGGPGSSLDVGLENVLSRDPENSPFFKYLARNRMP